MRFDRHAILLMRVQSYCLSSKMKYFVLYTILISLFLMSCASQPVNAQSGDEPVFSISLKNQDDQANIQHKSDTTTVDIHSPKGIGSVQLKLESGPMPERIKLRLYLKGLEELRLVSDRSTIVASASSSEMFNINQKLIASGNEHFLTPIDPLWMDIEIISGQAEQKIPLEEGFFEITVPKEFIQSAGDSFEIQWIDFYR